LISIVTTSWDDGSILDLKVAELLDRYGLKGAFYLPRSLFAHPLGKNDVIALDNRFEIRAHTLNHVDLTSIAPAEAKEEIEGSKTYLEDLLGYIANREGICYATNGKIFTSYYPTQSYPN
jgi:peptidoglycan/xylan/chitin deacetylase (PgdA/CDA1 family)